MFNALVEQIKSNWGVLRILGLAMGCFVMSQAVSTSSTMAMIFGAFILFQVVTNTGCFSTKGCAVPANNAVTDVQGDIDADFTEVKGK
jgi:uncharacterized membrane protein HdeD (DUF308 family)